MPHSFRSIILTKKMVLTALAEIALLAVSLYGFWSWSHYPAASLPGPDYYFSLIAWGIIPLVLIVVVAVRAAAAVGGALAATGYQNRINDLQHRLNKQDDLFHSISDSTPSILTIFDSDNQYWFVNASAARELGYAGNDVLGKRPAALLGAERGRRVEKSLDQVKKTNQTLEVLDRDVDGGGVIRYIQTSYQPLAPFGEFPGGVIARSENVTTIVVERERRERMLRQIIATLVGVVDRRDPYASGHSSRVGKLSRALALEMQLPEADADAAEIAGSLMNFGKVLISRSILTKTETLSPEELQRIRDGILTSADILSGIDFSAPVVPTLRQVLERYDGAGVPEGLTGDAILVTARIVAVANAFVALVSPRAYRAGIPFTHAVERLSQDNGKAFDPRVVAALDAYLTKNAAKLEWLSFMKPD
jgi:PAS domain S-box-containing protein